MLYTFLIFFYKEPNLSYAAQNVRELLKFKGPNVWRISNQRYHG